MAKKKLSHHHHNENNVQDKLKPKEQTLNNHHQPKSMDGSEEKLENLKSLNSMLLKETADRRHQVDSLQQSNVSLESELARSEMERGRLLAELSRSSEESLGLELEKSLVGAFLFSQIDGFRGDFSALVRAREGLVREVREVCRERDEIAKKGESEIKLVKDKVEQLVAALEVEGDLLRRVNIERDGLKDQLSVKAEEVNVLRLEMVEMEKSRARIQESNGKLEKELEGLTREKDEKEKVIESLVSDKGFIQRRLEDSLQTTEGLKRGIQGVIEDKMRIQEVNGRLEARIYDLQKEIGECNEAISSLENADEGLRNELLVMEEVRDDATKKAKQMEMKINDLVEENEERQRKIDMLFEGNEENQRDIDLLNHEKELAMRNLEESSNRVDAQKRKIEEQARDIDTLMGEKESVMRNLESSMNQVEVQNRKTEELVQEKRVAEDVNVQQEKRLVELGSKVDELTNSVLTLQRLCADRETKNKQLDEIIESYKNDVDRLTLEKITIVKCLDDEKRTVLEMKSHVSEAEKKLDETLKVLEKVRSDYSTLIRAKNQLEDEYEIAIMEKTTVNGSLIEAQKEIGLMSTMLKSTSTLLSLAGDEANGKRDMSVGGEHKIGEGIEHYVAELEAINKSFRDREMKAEEMKQQLDFLRNSVAGERKQKSFWTAVSSASMIFAAASAAYVAKAR